MDKAGATMSLETMSLERLTPLLTGVRARSHSLGAMDHARPFPLTTPAGHTPDEGADKTLTDSLLAIPLRWPTAGALTGSVAASIPPLSPHTSTAADARPPPGRVQDSLLFDTSPTSLTFKEDQKSSRLALQRAPHTLASSADIVSAVLGGPAFVHAAQTHTVSPHRGSNPLITTPSAVKAGGLSASRSPPSAPAPAAGPREAGHAPHAGETTGVPQPARGPAVAPAEAEDPKTSTSSPKSKKSWSWLLTQNWVAQIADRKPESNGENDRKAESNGESNGKSHGKSNGSNGKESKGSIGKPQPNIARAASTSSIATRAPPKAAQGSPHSSGSLTRWLGWTCLGPTDGSPLASGWDKAVSDSQRRKVR